MRQELPFSSCHGPVGPIWRRAIFVPFPLVAGVGCGGVGVATVAATPVVAAVAVAVVVAGGVVAVGDGVAVCGAGVVIWGLRPPRSLLGEAIRILLRADPWSRPLNAATRQASYCG
ncbi:hypothetical protein A3D60_00410 [Candidatus Uhrbacteria bacterium RIFCSPHIGHO2_02_FULL_47_29]|uniref:Uncharacterized protein n=1 Tax=Candidatus Uhrbacteria bacterium RIFCSPLOWO2_01_FULL_47_25 TaxID=1802402 RepID=A0A1F7UU52_9BACT|nr:MAG: hypothetical protein A2752_00375 [Candidatus Uhrbacteria bacterium RIFCSPHIGHO2_01_FULL_46_23]OGL68238.1 MAG: hypothetical protein A3D60_00410 [Candidatus Uhrbacteria bacterium RIFCSPHIGHO2_02_FULL_47_29]OGL81254.1 MAG: hypothetical protein A2936_03085 [Candidatus Uhrbacteria bacterium RIFCSPLOWO2_01_FULL_47_25]OGL86031.1 MAG: hypothetical protein A3I37_01425 [Candidatus Uhrbacteria bacterium RIFCSPLOWO2_02_FULL_46_19]